ncbi:transporter [Rubellicoccus peritrichatus]|uniref:Transporter n=1 Tax=Rubellicoccus peritrichatus TaxID=3080537 RepID=A0AAQ3QVD3_9BACT|nr:transporter [Puniceicoccus sp. CR14]WOO41478.1 transporter [Puniceicoccus sp. CR14]
MNIFKLRYQLAILTLCFSAQLAHSQNTSTVFSPNVTKGASAIEYRFAYDPDLGDIAQRIHYQYGITDQWRLRGIIQVNNTQNRSLQFQYFRMEALWQFLKAEDYGFDSGLRFEIQIPDRNDYPYRARIAWTGAVDLTDAWELRGNFLLGREFGPDRDSGITPEGRAEVNYSINKYLTGAVDYFADLNTTVDSGSFNEQEHQLGPLLKFKFDKGWKGYAGALFGLSKEAPQVEYRIMMSYNF